MNKQIAIIIVFALGASTAARAETQEEQQACTNDAFQFCQNAIPDRNRVFTCLVENRNAISAACHAVMAAYLPADPPPLKKQAVHTKPAKTKGPIVLAPH
jgi:hypothetical protein